jgi:NAD(P)-dependent dehydrogenase (short-subunit alcohol dehydrogenase family)
MMSLHTAPPPLTLKPNAASAERLADDTAWFVVSGGSRGLGLQFCRALLVGSKGSVIALSRAPEQSDGLLALGEDFPGRLCTISVDLTSEESIRQAATAAAGVCDHVDMLINCAGILHDNRLVPERSLVACNAEWMHRVYTLNAVAPVLLTAAFVPLLSGTPSSRPRVVANLSARVGSVSDNRLGGWWSYRMSKAALNMATRNMAIELKRKRVLALALHPGTTDTDLSKPFQKSVKPEKLFTTEFAVDSMLKIIYSAEDVHSGHLFAWDGQLIPF